MLLKTFQYCTGYISVNYNQLFKIQLLSYNWLKKKKYPFKYKGLKFIRVPFRALNGVEKTD